LQLSPVSSSTPKSSPTGFLTLPGTVSSQSGSQPLESGSSSSTQFSSSQSLNTATTSLDDTRATTAPEGPPARVTSSGDIITETIYTTVVSTVYKCASTVKDCPFSERTPSPVTQKIPTATSVYSISTSTVYETRTHTISACPLWKRKCRPSEMTTSMATETSEAYTTTVWVPIASTLPTITITDIETKTRDELSPPSETTRVTKMVTILACPAEYDA
jgi:hypothetical protein